MIGAPFLHTYITTHPVPERVQEDLYKNTALVWRPSSAQLRCILHPSVATAIHAHFGVTTELYPLAPYFSPVFTHHVPQNAGTGLPDMSSYTWDSPHKAVALLETADSRVVDALQRAATLRDRHPDSLTIFFLVGHIPPRLSRLISSLIPSKSFRHRLLPNRIPCPHLDLLQGLQGPTRTPQTALNTAVTLVAFGSPPSPLQDFTSTLGDSSICTLSPTSWDTTIAPCDDESSSLCDFLGARLTWLGSPRTPHPYPPGVTAIPASLHEICTSLAAYPVHMAARGAPPRLSALLTYLHVPHREQPAVAAYLYRTSLCDLRALLGVYQTALRAFASEHSLPFRSTSRRAPPTAAPPQLPESLPTPPPTPVLPDCVPPLFAHHQLFQRPWGAYMSLASRRKAATLQQALCRRASSLTHISPNSTAHLCGGICLSPPHSPCHDQDGPCLKPCGHHLPHAHGLRPCTLCGGCAPPALGAAPTPATRRTFVTRAKAAHCDCSHLRDLLLRISYLDCSRGDSAWESIHHLSRREQEDRRICKLLEGPRLPPRRRHALGNSVPAPPRALPVATADLPSDPAVFSGRYAFPPPRGSSDARGLGVVLIFPTQPTIRIIYANGYAEDTTIDTLRTRLVPVDSWSWASQDEMSRRRAAMRTYSPPPPTPPPSAEQIFWAWRRTRKPPVDPPPRAVANLLVGRRVLASYEDAPGGALLTRGGVIEHISDISDDDEDEDEGSGDDRPSWLTYVSYDDGDGGHVEWDTLRSWLKHPPPLSH